MRPRNKDIRRYKKEETGTRTFKIKDLEAEIPLTVKSSGNGYIGTEFEGMECVVLVFRKKEENKDES